MVQIGGMHQGMLLLQSGMHMDGYGMVGSTSEKFQEVF